MRNIIVGPFGVILIAAMGLLAMSPQSHGEQDWQMLGGYKIYHCKTPQGTVFQQQPCAGDHQDAQYNPTNISSSRDRAQSNGAPVTLNFNAVQIGDLLKIISQVAGYNLELEDRQLSSTRTNVRYINVPWTKALDDLSNKYKFKVSFDKQDMIITTAEDVDYNNLVDELEVKYPQINPKSSSYDQSVINEIQREMANYQQQYPSISDEDALEHVYPTVLGQDATGSAAPVNAVTKPSSADQTQRYVLHSLGKMFPPFLLGVLVIGVIWGGVAIARGRRGR